jgi:hypothetical protein
MLVRQARDLISDGHLMTARRAVRHAKTASDRKTEAHRALMGKPSSRLPENATSWRWPISVRRSGRVWSKRSFRPLGWRAAASVTRRA